MDRWSCRDKLVEVFQVSEVQVLMGRDERSFRSVQEAGSSFEDISSGEQGSDHTSKDTNVALVVVKKVSAIEGLSAKPRSKWC